MGVDPGVEGVCREAAFELGRAGAAVEEIDLDLSHARSAFLDLRGRWMVAHHQDRLDRIGELGPNLAGNIRAGLATTPGQLGRADRIRSELWDRFADLRRDFDYLLTPCTAVPPFPVEQSHPTEIAGRRMESYVDWFAPTFVLSLTGLPVASVPAGLDPRGLPVGLQVVGPAGGEEAVLALAATLERLRPPERPSARGVTAQRAGCRRGSTGAASRLARLPRGIYDLPDLPSLPDIRLIASRAGNIRHRTPID